MQKSAARIFVANFDAKWVNPTTCRQRLRRRSPFWVSAWLRHVNGERLRRFALFAMEPPI